MRDLVSVFTPSHDTRFLDDCYRSLALQTYADWEWIVLLNGQATDWRPSIDDERVWIIRDRTTKGIGGLKRAACERARGTILLELDHDDALLPTCIEEVVDAFDAHPKASLVYSDFAQINADGSPNLERFNPAMGWIYSDVSINDTTYSHCHGMVPSPHNVAYIWYAPNHVRAMRKSTYDGIGGYDGSLTVLDDQDLMMRLYVAGDFVHLPKPLYLQRFHGQNTQVDASTNAFIQEQTVRYYQDRIEGIATAWARRNGLAVVDLETPTSPPGGRTGDESILVDPADPVLRVDAGSVGVIFADELLQRIADRTALFNSCYDALAHAGFLFTRTPSTDGRGAFQDPSHVAFYNENSFWYVTQRNMSASMPGLRARFQVSNIRTHFPTEWHQSVSVPYVDANLLAIHDGPRQGGPLLW